jgi:hypothetical protein
MKHKVDPLFWWMMAMGISVVAFSLAAFVMGYPK